MYKVRIISEEDILRHELLHIGECVNDIEDMFQIMALGDYQMGGKNGNSHGTRLVYDRENDDKNKNIFIAMPSYLGGNIRCSGIKWHGPNVVGSSDAETKHTLVLNDYMSGVPKGIIAANTLTTYRTAAVSVCAAKALAMESAKVLSIVGPGRINKVFAEGVLQELPSIEKIKVKGRGKASINKFVQHIKGKFDDVEIQVVDTLEEAVKESDVISVITGFEYEDVKEMPIIREHWVKKGALIICPSFIKFSDDFIVNKSVSVVDNLKMYESYAEELGYPVYKALSNLGNRLMDLVHEDKMSMETIIDFKDVISQNVIVRKSDEDIILFCSGGIGTEDIAVGNSILKKAEEMNIGQVIDW